MKITNDNIMSFHKKLTELAEGLTKNIETDTMMSLDYFNDFYYLEALKADINMRISTNPEVGFRRAVEKLQEDVQKTCAEMYPNIALRLFVYIYAACLGEARHARTSIAKKLYIQETLGQSREGLFSSVYEYPPTTENVSNLIKVFEQDWRSSFGGAKWLDIAKALRMYFDVDNATFIDHVADLQHNNGTVFSKEESKYCLSFNIKHEAGFQDFLDYKFKYNILQKSHSFLRVTHAVKNLVNRYNVIFQTKETFWVISKSPRLREYKIRWGNASLTLVNKWADWADCEEGNTPKMEWVMYKSGIERISVHKLTLKEFKQSMQEILERAKEICKDYPETLPKLEKFAKKYIEDNKSYCKLEKCKTTYAVVPAKIKTPPYDYDIEIQIPLPYYGYGEKTDYGFVIKTGCQGIEDTGNELGYDGKPGFNDAIIEKGNYGKLKISTSNGNWIWNDNNLEALIK